MNTKITPFRRLFHLFVLLAALLGAPLSMAQTVSFITPGSAGYEPGGQTTYVLQFTKSGAGTLSAPITLNFSAPQISSVSWAVQSFTSGTTFSTGGIPNGTSDISLTVNFPADDPADVFFRIQVRNRFDATGNYTLTANSGAASGPMDFIQGASLETVCSLPGNDGNPGTITATNSILNTYFGSPADSTARTVSAGTRCLPIDSANAAGFNPGTGSRADDIQLGDLLLIIQMQGADINTADTTAYGDGNTSGGDSYTNAGGATSQRQTGVYEFALAQGTINSAGAGLTSPCTAGAGTAANPDVLPISSTGPSNGLNFNYERQENAASGIRRNYQIIRVPQFTDLSFSGSGSIAALPWTGTIGGVLVIDVEGTINLGSGAPTDVRFNVEGRGFRGGAARIATGLAGSNLIFRKALAALPNDAHGMKGEGIAGTPSEVFDGSSVISTGFSYLNGSIGRGAPGNAGGGGNACTPATNTNVSGGAGGSNSGQAGNGGNCADPTGSLSTRTMGGKRPTAFFSDGTLLFMGGGGGAGVKRVSSAGTNDASGGSGGGVILIRANTVNGQGTFNANGTAGQPGSLNRNESGGGGGGGGGSIMIIANIGGGNVFTDTRILANGGAGGNAAEGEVVNVTNNTGPGGGGGGGRFFSTNLSNQLTGIITTDGGFRGQTTVGLVDYGANNGDVGQADDNQDAFTLTPGPKPGFVCASGTVPVTLSDVKASLEGSQLVVRFGTASEAGTLGFRAYQNQLGSKDFALNRNQLTVAAGSSSKPQRYEIRGENRGATEVWIEEVSTSGKSVYYGPYPVNLQIGETEIATLTNWSAINVAQRAYRSLEVRDIVQRTTATGVSTELRVASDGWYRVTHEQLLAAGVDYSGVASNQLRIQRGVSKIGSEISGPATFGPGSAISFYGDSVKGSLYTDQAVYTLTGQTTEALGGVFANSGSLGAVTSNQYTTEFSPNRGYSFSSPIADPWYATRIVRSGTSAGLATETVTITDRLPGADERLKVQLWGGTSFPEVLVDHSVAVSVNGVQVATASFDGINAQEIDVSLPANVLNSGVNNISVQLTENAASADVVYLESISLTYQRKLKVEADGQLAFAPSVTGAAADRLFGDNFSDGGLAACVTTEAGCQAYRVELTGAVGRAFKISNGRAQALTSAKVKNIGGTSVIEFAGVAAAGERYLVTQSDRSPTISLAQPDADLLAGSNISYLIITHPSFASELGPLVLAKQAQGLNVKVVNVESLYRAYSDGELSPAAISAYLGVARQTWPALKYVLLVGGDSYDYKNYLGNSSISFVPTQYRRTHEVVSYAPVDQLYADLNADGRPELSIGRMPVRTTMELRNIINKTLAYANAGTAGKLVWANDRDSNGYPFGGKSDEFAGHFNGWVKGRVDLNAYATNATADARTSLLAQVNAGQAILGYYGHSSPSNWTRESLLTAAMLNQGGLLTNATQPTTVVQFGCWGAYFVDPQYTSIAHALLLNENGAAALIASSALTDVVSDEVLAAELLPRLNDGLSFGEANQLSTFDIRTSNPTAIDVWLGSSVLGDPALIPND